MKKMLLFLLAGVSASSFAFTVNIENNTPLGELQLISTNGTHTISATGTTTLNLDQYTVYQIKYDNQIFANLTQNNYYAVQATPSIGSSWQNVTLRYSAKDSNDNSYSGSLQTAGSSKSGNCASDIGKSVTCRAASDNVAPGVINITLTGGEAPKPLSPYTYNAGEWNKDTIYQPKSNPTLYPIVTYDGLSYVACWYAAGTHVPGSGDPWKLYSASNNVCN